MVLLAAVHPPPVRAADPDQATPWLLSEEELEAAGWQYGEAERQSGSVIGGILATTVGAVVHGVGHLYAGDTRTGTTLLISESVGLGLFAGGLLTQALSDSDGGLSNVYRPLLALGGSLFLTTWLLDVLGTFKGTDISLPERATALDRLGLAAGYSHLFQASGPLRSSLTLEANIDFGWLFAQPRGRVGLDQDLLSLGGAVGLRFGFGRRPYSFFDLRLEGDEVILDDQGYAYESLVISLGVSLDLGDLFAHLDGLVYQNRLGFGTQLYRFRFDRSAPLNANNTVGLLLVQANLNARILDNLVLDLGYIQRPDSLVANLSHTVGSFFATMTYELPARLEWFLAGQAGSGFQVISGLAFTLDQ